MSFFKPFEMPTGASIPGKVFSVMDFGASAEDRHAPVFPDSDDARKALARRNTKAFADAIAAANRAGGGRVEVPEGIFFTGPIHFQSGVELHLAKGCLLRFSSERKLYLPAVFTLFEGIRCYTYSSMIYAKDCHDIALTGEGQIDGQGATWWPIRHQNEAAVKLLYRDGEKHTPVEERRFYEGSLAVRPGLLHFVECQNVTIEGITFTMSPFWTVHPTWCENIIVRNITVRNPLEHAPNTDGCNFEGCVRGLAENITVDTGDDAICLKSGRDEDGRVAARPCHDIVIRGLRVIKAHGGITIGSEMSGGVYNILGEDLDFANNYNGVWIKTAPERGGTVNNCTFRHMRGDRLRHTAICLSMGYYVDNNKPGAEQHLPTMYNIDIEDYHVNWTHEGIKIIGCKDSTIRFVKLENVEITAEEPEYIENAETVWHNQVQLHQA